ncbi:hypothetical protein ACC870_37845, partial [Rhizobium ruizarguesonis]
MSSSTEQQLINSVLSGKAVTIGTNSSVSGSNLVGSHAYTVTGYDAATGKFTFDNPWGHSDPTPLTWSQIVPNCMLFTV